MDVDKLTDITPTSPPTPKVTCLDNNFKEIMDSLATPNKNKNKKQKMVAKGQRNDWIFSKLSVQELEAKYFECKYIQSVVDTRMKLCEEYIKKKESEKEKGSDEYMKDLQNDVESLKQKLNYRELKIAQLNAEITELKKEIAQKDQYILTTEANNHLTEAELRRTKEELLKYQIWDELFTHDERGIKHFTCKGCNKDTVFHNECFECMRRHRVPYRNLDEILFRCNNNNKPQQILPSIKTAPKKGEGMIKCPSCLADVYPFEYDKNENMCSKCLKIQNCIID